MAKSESFSILYVPAAMNGEHGFEWTVRDSKRRVRATGWSHGSKKWAEKDARDVVARLQATNVINTETRSAS